MQRIAGERTLEVIIVARGLCGAIYIPATISNIYIEYIQRPASSPLVHPPIDIGHPSEFENVFSKHSQSGCKHKEKAKNENNEE